MEYLTGGLLSWLLRLLQHAEVPNLTHSEPNLPLGCKKKTPRHHYFAKHTHHVRTIYMVCKVYLSVQ